MHSGDSSDTIRLRIAPLALLFIICATAVPVDFRAPATDVISLRLNPQDFLLNILLFVPLGVALARQRAYITVAACAALSLSIEALQIVHANRHVGSSDVLANIAGGVLGALSGRLRPSWRDAQSGLVHLKRSAFSSLALVVGVGLLLAIGATGQPHDFSNWDPTYRLAFADEITRDRPWDGKLLAWAVYDHPIERGAIRALADRRLSDGGVFAVDELPLDAVTLWESHDPLEPGRFMELSPDESDTLYTRLRSTDRMSLLAWFRVQGLEQDDLRRILTFSQDPFHRNFTLGQDGGAVEFRLRTPASGLNGNDPETRTSEILKPGQSVFVAATYDGFVARLFVDGNLAARRDLSAAGAGFPILHGANLALGLAICGGCLGGLFSVLLGERGWSRRFLLGMAGGTGVIAGAWALEALEAWPVSPIRTLLQMAPPIAGGLVVAMSLVQGRNSDHSSSRRG